MSVIENMQKMLRLLYETQDTEWIAKHGKELNTIEFGQTFKEYKAAADYTYNLLKEEGFDAEIITFPADGKTTYMDMRTPMAWEASVGRLTVTKSSVPFAEPVVADYEKHPFHLIKHSTATPAGGVRVKLVTEAQVYAGEDCRGAMVLLNADTPPRPYAISPLLDLGAMGFVSDYIRAAADTPDAVQWVNAGTDDTSHWHVQADDRDFIGFSISPRVGRKLRQAAESGAVEVLVESDGRRYEGEIYGVTALIPGKKKQELWLMAHLYEPFIADNAVSVTMTIGTVKQLLKLIQEGKLPPLTYSIRLVFAMESYGYTAMAAHFGGALHNQVIGGLNIDTPPVQTIDTDFKTDLVPYATPFFGNYIYRLAAKAFEKEFPHNEKFVSWVYNYGDDCMVGDSTIGVPSIYVEHCECYYWHNSIQSNDVLCEEKLHRVQSFTTLWAAQMVLLNEENLPEMVKASAELAKERLAFEMTKGEQYPNQQDRMAYFMAGEQAQLKSFKKIADVPEIDEAITSLQVPELPNEIQELRWLTYAKGIVGTRSIIGFPHDLIKLPKEKRRILPNDVMYGPLGMILSAMDGKRNLAELIQGALWESGQPITEKNVKTQVDAVMFLADSGYLSVINENDITKEQIKDTLQALGIEKNDILLVHSSQSGCGHIKGGAETVIEAFYETVGENGGMLMPTFTRPYVAFEGAVNKARNYRPFSPDNIDNIWVGTMPKVLLKKFNAKRSAHCSHSWAGLGKKAEESVMAQGLLDPPASETSPMAKALAMGGKVVFFGCGLGSNTFVHHVEHLAQSAFLENAIVKVEDASGKQHTEVIHNHVPGCRDFYEPVGIQAKFYQRAIAKGLEIRKAKLGLGTVSCIDLKQLYEIGMELFREDPNVTLCDRPECPFCKKYR
ncbi:MAG: AAC(3) family N-acetyltransferase [Clostridia bacterium]|nr:AAC(3) family N-acetyltransferase [Clostridia bacterium]